MVHGPGSKQTTCVLFAITPMESKLLSCTNVGLVENKIDNKIKLIIS